MQNENAEFGNALDGIEAVSTSPQEAPPIQQPATTQAQPAPSMVSVPQSAFAKLKEEQRRRGQREAMESLEAKFKAHGFGSLDEALAAAAATRQQPAKAAPQQMRTQPAAPAVSTTERESPLDSRQLQKLQRERERLAKQFAQEQAQRRKLQRQLEAKEAEMSLREAAVSHGVRDVDYALRLLQRELDGKSEEQLNAFNEAEFFGKKLRSSHPYLYGETVVPATTGTGATGPTAPTAASVQAATGQAGQFDARKATTAEFHAELRRLGLNPVGV